MAARILSQPSHVLGLQAGAMPGRGQAAALGHLDIRRSVQCMLRATSACVLVALSMPLHGQVLHGKVACSNARPDLHCSEAVSTQVDLMAVRSFVALLSELLLCWSCRMSPC